MNRTTVVAKQRHVEDVLSAIDEWLARQNALKFSEGNQAAGRGEGAQHDLESHGAHLHVAQFRDWFEAVRVTVVFRDADQRRRELRRTRATKRFVAASQSSAPTRPWPRRVIRRAGGQR
jgi:hypothetical protein